jgi:exopolysaccharide production protein ExoZ
MGITFVGRVNRKNGYGVAGRAFAEWLPRWLASVYELPSDKGRIISLEGIRGLAALLVFFVHYHSLFKHYLRADSLSFSMSHFSWSVGPSGVDLFFVLSGYLIYRIVMQKQTSYSRFMYRRAERIYPTFLFVLAAYITLSLAVPGQNKLPPDPAGAGLFILENVALLPGVFNITPIITVAWSLSYEWFFYATIPALVSVLGMKRWKVSKRVVVITVLSVTYIICGIGRKLPHIHLPMFALGMLIYEFSGSAWVKSKLSRAGEVAAIVIFVACFPLVYLLQSRQSGSDADTTLWDGSVIGILYGGFFWFFMYALNYDGVLKRSLSCAPLRWMGNISYSYYLLHGLVLNSVALALKSVPQMPQHGTVMFWACLPLAFLATVVVSTAVFLQVERRFSLVKKTSVSARSLAVGASS